MLSPLLYVVADPDPLPQGRLHRRLRGGAPRAARQGRRRALGLDHRAAQGRLVGRARALEQARSLGQALRLFLGRRHPRAGPARGRRPMLAGHHRRHARRQEGTRRPDRRGARECAILEGTAPRPEAARTCDGARARGRRRRARLLAGGRGSVAQDARPALLGAQNRERPEQAAQEPALESQAGAAGDLDGRDQDGCACSVRCLRRNLGRQIRQGGRVLDQRSTTRCSPSTTSPPSTGSICARPTSSKARSRRCATAPCAPRDVFPTRPRSP